MNKYTLTLFLLFINFNIVASENKLDDVIDETSVVYFHNLEYENSCEKLYQISCVPYGQEKNQQILSENGKELFIFINKFDFKSLNIAKSLLLFWGFKLTQDDLNYNFLQFFFNWNYKSFRNIKNYNELDILFLEIIHLFIKCGVNINCKTTHLETALHLVNDTFKIKSYSTTALEFNYALVSYKNISINERDKFGNTPLYYAKLFKNIPVVGLLLKFGAKD